MNVPVKYEHINSFQINIDDLGCGWELISLCFNGVPISFRASYIGAEPLGTLIETVDALDEEYISGSNVSQYFIDWVAEPGCMSISFERNFVDDRLTIVIKESENEDINDDPVKRWNFAMDYSLFRRAVVDTVISALNKYGICGFNRSWNADREALPIWPLLSVLGVKPNPVNGSCSFKSDLSEEVAILSRIISHKEQQ